MPSRYYNDIDDTLSSVPEYPTWSYPTYDWKIQGIPCKVSVVEFIPLHDECGRSYEMEYLILDRKGYPAPWLQKKMTEDNIDELEQQIIRWRKD